MVPFSSGKCISILAGIVARAVPLLRALELRLFSVRVPRPPGDVGDLELTVPMLAKISWFGSVAMSRSIGERVAVAQIIAPGTARRIVPLFDTLFVSTPFSFTDFFLLDTDDFNMAGDQRFSNAIESATALRSYVIDLEALTFDDRLR